MSVLFFMRNVFEARKTLNVDLANAPEEYRPMAAELHE
jgi:hypothetical protein